MSTLKDLKYELERLERVDFAPEVMAAKKLVLEKRKPEIDKVKKQIEDLRAKKSPPKPRIPENCPDNIIKACEKFWDGTEEFWKFRIHVWNDKAVWTSYPAGGYSTNGGWTQTSPYYYLISLTEKDLMERSKMKILAEIDCDTGRNPSRIGKKVTEKELLQILEEKT